MIKKIDHINICVTNLEEAKKFFIDLLEFKLIGEGHLEGAWIDQVVGLSNVKAKFIKLNLPQTETNLELIEYYSPQGETDPKINIANQIGYRHLALNVTNIETHFEKLKKAGIKINSEIQNYNESKKLFYFAGPDNIILELAEYSD